MAEIGINTAIDRYLYTVNTIFVTISQIFTNNDSRQYNYFNDYQVDFKVIDTLEKVWKMF